MLTAAPRVATGRLASGAVKDNSAATAASILNGSLGFAGEKKNTGTLHFVEAVPLGSGFRTAKKKSWACLTS